MDKKRIEKIRRSLGDAEVDNQLFTDEEIEEVLKENDSDNFSLYVLYLQKAGRLITNESFIKSIKAGNEELSRLNASELQAMALEQAKKYKELYDMERSLYETSRFVY